MLCAAAGKPLANLHANGLLWFTDSPRAGRQREPWSLTGPARRRWAGSRPALRLFGGSEGLHIEAMLCGVSHARSLETVQRGLCPHLARLRNAGARQHLSAQPSKLCAPSPSRLRAACTETTSAGARPIAARVVLFAWFGARQKDIDKCASGLLRLRLSPATRLSLQYPRAYASSPQSPSVPQRSRFCSEVLAARRHR